MEEVSEIEVEENLELADAIEALKALGYKTSELNSIKKELLALDHKTSDQYVRSALTMLAKRKGV